MTVFFTLLLCAASFATILVGALASDFHKSDAAGEGMAQGFAFIVAIFLWIALGILVLICGSRNGFPGVLGFVVPIICFAAAVGHFAALNVLKEAAPGSRTEFLLRTVVVACPWAVILYSVWNYFGPVRTLLPAAAATLIAAVPLLVLAIVPWLTRGPVKDASAARLQAYQDELAKENKLVEEVNALPPDVPLAAFLQYTDLPPEKSGNVRGEALKRMQMLPRRQAEAEALLANSDIRLLRDLADLDLTMTPAVCRDGRKTLRRVAEVYKPADAATTFDSMESRFNSYLNTIRWLQTSGCACNEEIAALEQTVRLYPASYPRKWFTDYLLELQGKPREP